MLLPGMADRSVRSVHSLMGSIDAEGISDGMAIADAINAEDVRDCTTIVG